MPWAGTINIVALDYQNEETHYPMEGGKKKNVN